MYSGYFSDAEDVFNSFCVPSEEQEGVRILFADYEQQDYDGTAFVFFLRRGKFYVVHGSHCSCYGLEEQWDPEEITIGEIRHFGENSSSSYWQNGAILKAVDRVAHLNLETLSDETIQLYMILAMG